MNTQTPQATDAGRCLADAQRLLSDVTSGKWIAGGLKAGGGLMAPVDEASKPIHQLEAAELGWLVPQVQPLQDTQDRIAVHTQLVQSYADAWQSTSAKINDVGQCLAQYAPDDTQQWQGESADLYRSRADEIATALEALATVDQAKTAAAVAMGEVASDAHKQVGDLLTSLIQQLISYLGKARATQGGALTADNLAEATRLINSYATPIADLDRKLTDSANNLIAGSDSSGRAQATPTDDQAVSSVGLWGQIYKAIAKALGGKVDDGLPNPMIPTLGTIPPVAGIKIKPWPKRKDYKVGPGFGRDWHQAMAELERAYEGKTLINGWRVTKVERTLGGTKRVDFMMVRDSTKEIQVVDYYTGKVEPLSHIEKSWSYQNEPEILDLKAKGYQYREPVTGYPDALQ